MGRELKALKELCAELEREQKESNTNDKEIDERLQRAAYYLCQADNHAYEAMLAVEKATSLRGQALTEFQILLKKRGLKNPWEMEEEMQKQG